MSSVKQYIKNPKFGQGNEPEFLSVGTTGIDAVKNRLLQVERQELNLTIKNSKNYSTLTEAIANVTDDKYKFKGFILTFNNGTDWVSKRYNGEDASGFADEGNWIDVGGAAGSTQYLDLSMFSAESGTLSEEDYQKVVKAYEDKISTAYFADELAVPSSIASAGDGSFIILCYLLNGSTKQTDVCVYTFNVNADKSYSYSTSMLNSITGNDGTKALTDNGQYAEFAKPIKYSSIGNQTGEYELEPNSYYQIDVSQNTNFTITLKSGKPNSYNEYMFEFTCSDSPITLADIPNIKWQNGDKLVPEANCTYQVSIVNNCAVYAKFPNA